MVFGLKHKFKIAFELNADTSTKDSTIVPLFTADQNHTSPENINVNPRHDTYAGVVDDASCYIGSKISKMHIRFGVSIAPDATLVTSAVYRSWDICLGLGDHEIKKKDDTTLLSVLNLREETVGQKYIEPIWNGTNLDAGRKLPDPWTPSDIQGVNVDYDSFENEMLKDEEFEGILKAVTNGGFKDFVVHKDRPFISDRWIEVDPRVKRIHDKTFCGIGFHLPTEATSDEQVQLYGQEVTADDVLRIGMSVQYTEYNEEFYQKET